MKGTRDKSRNSLGERLWLYLVFTVSGFAALLYQVAWQRALYAIYGINIESVTMVVTAFMLGLGLGSLAGGALSKDKTRPILLYFSIVEAGIGAFGLGSLALFAAIGDATLAMSTLATGIVTFLLVLVPTLLMGATLPLLVGHLVRDTGNVGKSVGTLYFVNTLGSALASFAAVMWVLGHEGLAGTVRFAAYCNFTVSAVVLVKYVMSRSSTATARAEAS